MIKKRVMFAQALSLALLASTTACAASASEGDAASAPGCLDKAPADGHLKAGEAVKGSFKGTTLTFVGYGGSFQEAQSAGYLKPFEACTGAVVEETSPGDYAKLKAMVEAKNVSWDVVYYGAQVVAQNCGVLAEHLDPAKVDLSNTVLPADYKLSDCQAPVEIEPSYIAYDDAKFKNDPPSSIDDFFNVQKYPGKRLIYADPGSAIPDFITAVALSLGYTQDDLAKQFPYDAVFAKIRTLGSNLTTYTTFSESQQRLEAGDIAMGWVAAGRAYAARTNGVTYTPVWSQNSWGYLVADLFIPKGSPNKEAAEALINYAMGPQQQAVVTEKAVYNPTNADSKPHIPADMEPYVGTPERLQTGFTITNDYWLQHNDELTQRWSEFVTSLGH
jgi:putative spermidine/putrescine transport system substrate-binding protein